MKNKKLALTALSIILVAAMIGCASGPKVRVVELENKGTSMGLSTPDWIKNYTAYGISRVQAQSEFRDKYCIIGEESGVNRQFVLTWADNFSAQQRIGAMLRTTIASEYQARVQGAAQSQGGANSAAGTSSGEYRQEIDSVINSLVNVSYSGAQREADWWSLRRRYDPDQKDLFTDEYTAYVLYTIPKAELNRQIASALETAVNADSALYDITIEMARQILQNGLAGYLGAGDLPPAATPPQRPEEVQAAGTNPAKITIRNNSNSNSSILTSVRIYQGFEARGEPYLIYDSPVLNGQQATWNLGEGVYTFETFLNNNRAGVKMVGVTAGDEYSADFWDGNLSSFSRK